MKDILGILKEFDEIAPSTLEIDGYSCDLTPVIDRIRKHYVASVNRITEDLLEIIESNGVKIHKGQLPHGMYGTLIDIDKVRKDYERR